MSNRKSHDSQDKEAIITQLKARIFELEQNEKNFSLLNHKFRNLTNENTMLSEEKLRLEYELKQRNEMYNQQVNEIRSDLVNLQENFNDKIGLNKKLYADLSNLERILESKNDDIDGLRSQLNDYIEGNSRLLDEKRDLEKQVSELRDIRQQNKTHIEKLYEDNERLNKTCRDQDLSIKHLHGDIQKLSSKVEDSIHELNNMKTTLRNREESLVFTQKQLDESSKHNIRLQGLNKDQELNIERLKGELNNATNLYQKENRLRVDKEHIISELEKVVSDRDKEIRRLVTDLESVRLQKESLMNDNQNLIAECERLNAHIGVLTEQNRRFQKELECILDQDEIIRNQINRKERIVGMMSDSNYLVEKSANSVNRSSLNTSQNIMQGQSNRNTSPYKR